MNENQNINFTFRLSGLELSELTYTVKANALTDSPTFNFDLSIQHKINTAENAVLVSPSVKITAEDKITELGFLKIICVFTIENLEDFRNSENQINLPEPIVVTLNSIALSTLRGVMFSEFRGTQLHNVILPIIDPKVFQSK